MPRFGQPFRLSFGRSLVLAAIAVVLATSCGGGDGDDADEGTISTAAAASTADESTEVDTTDTTADDTANAVDDTADATADDIADNAAASAQEFSQCMRDAGVDVPDLAVDATGQLDIGGLVSSVDPADPAVQQALLACQGSLDGGLAGSLNSILQSQTFADALISFSQCVRDDGYEVEDLTFAAVAGAVLGSGVDTSNPDEDAIAPILATALGLDPDDPAVADTINGCVTIIRNGLGDLGLGG